APRQGCCHGGRGGRSKRWDWRVRSRRRGRRGRMPPWGRFWCCCRGRRQLSVDNNQEALAVRQLGTVRLGDAFGSRHPTPPQRRGFSRRIFLSASQELSPSPTCPARNGSAEPAHAVVLVLR